MKSRSYTNDTLKWTNLVVLYHDRVANKEHVYCAYKPAVVSYINFLVNDIAFEIATHDFGIVLRNLVNYY